MMSSVIMADFNNSNIKQKVPSIPEYFCFTEIAKIRFQQGMDCFVLYLSKVLLLSFYHFKYNMIPTSPSP
jgi:hypothetical protein